MVYPIQKLKNPEIVWDALSMFLSLQFGLNNIVIKYKNTNICSVHISFNFFLISFKYAMMVCNSLFTMFCDKVLL